LRCPWSKAAKVSSAPTLTVVKIGGSVLTGHEAIRRTAGTLAARVARERAKLLVVVSAELGHTDLLFDEARALSPGPSAAALDLLWSTGELRSVALLTLALESLGVAVRALNVHEAGLHSDGRELTLNPLAVRAALAHCSIVVVPGFLATREQRVVTLGRGGSDLSAVSLAILLRADRCELVKDVDGYFTADPNIDARATLIPALEFEEALRLADDGCPLVQRQAIAAARAAGLPLVVRSLTSKGSVLHARPSVDRPTSRPLDFSTFQEQ
jgi:aspartate kinase